MNAKCSICFDVVGHSPFSTRCGHLYCPDCAAFNFNSSDNPFCAICRTPQKYVDLIQLFPDPVEPSFSQAPLHANVADSIVDACVETLGQLKSEDWNADQADSHLLQVGDHLNQLDQKLDDGSDARPLLKTVGKILEHIRSQVDEIRKAQVAIQKHHEDERKSLELAARRAELIARESRTDARKQRFHKDEQIALQQAKHEAELQRLQEKLRSAYREVDTTCVQRAVALDHVSALEDQVGRMFRLQEETQIELDRLQTDLDTSRDQELKYKKKYYALRNKVHESKQRALGKRTANEDDELTVLPPKA